MIVLALNLLAAVALSVSMQRHWKQVLEGRPYSRPRALALRAVGYLLLLVAGIVALRTHGAVAGLAFFCAMFTVSIVGIAVVLPYWTGR
ncbi:MAG: DUF3325 family protein [Acidobacteriota bacterium]